MSEPTNNAWQSFRGDFDAMTDKEVEHEAEMSRLALEEAEEWLEAVASWESAGKPRTIKSEDGK